MLSQTLTVDDDKEFRVPEEEGGGTDSTRNGNNHDCEQDGNDNKEDAILKNLQKMSKLYKILTLLRDKGHADSECVTNLNVKFTQVEDSSNNDSVREVHAEG